MDIVEKFNQMFPVGSTVLWRSVAHEKVEHKQYEVREKAIWSNGQPVAFLKGKAGYVSIEPQFVNYSVNLL